MEMSMSMYATSSDYWQHYAELLAQTMNETAAALGVEPDNESMLEAVDALRKDAERYRKMRSADMDTRTRLEHYSDSALDVVLDALPAVG